MNSPMEILLCIQLVLDKLIERKKVPSSWTTLSVILKSYQWNHAGKREWLNEWRAGYRCTASERKVSLLKCSKALLERDKDLKYPTCQF